MTVYEGRVIAYRSDSVTPRQGDSSHVWYVGRVKDVTDSAVTLQSGEAVPRDADALLENPPSWLMETFVESKYEQFVYVQRSVGGGPKPAEAEWV